MTKALGRERVIINFLTVAVASGCHVWPANGDDRGSGGAGTQTRHVGEFRKIDVRGSTDVMVVVGQSTSVVVSGDHNLLSQVTTEVVGGTLVVGRSHGSRWQRGMLVVTVALPALDGVAIHGSADVDVQGLNAPRFVAKIPGSGNLRVVGRTRELDASVSGSGDMRLFDLMADKAQVSIAGSGDVQVNVSQDLVARIAGSGDVSYRGEPRTQISVKGSGSVRRS